jgi:hypothetical protein
MDYCKKDNIKNMLNVVGLQMACGMLSAIGDFLQTGIDEIMKVIFGTNSSVKSFL